MRYVRNSVGSLLALLGATATLISPWLAWYGGRHGSSYKFYEVFGTGITSSVSGVMDSVFLVFLVAAIITIVGVVLRSRAVVLIAAVLALGFVILWMIRQGQAAGQLAVTGDSRGLGPGLAVAFGGALAMFIGALLMKGRHHRRKEREEEYVAADRAEAGRSREPRRWSRHPARTTTTTTATTATTAGTERDTGWRTGRSQPTETTAASTQPQPTAQPEPGTQRWTTRSETYETTSPSPQQPEPTSAQQPGTRTKWWSRRSETTQTPTGAGTPTGEAAAPEEQEQATPTTPPSERTGTERLSKEERELLGLDEEVKPRGRQER